MGCGRNENAANDRRHENCICEVVRAIRRIQNIQDDVDCNDCRTDCFLAPLGSIVSPSRQRANTRVFMLMNEEGNPFKAMFNNTRRHHHHHDLQSNDSSHDCVSCFSVFFRVQNVFDNCCATLQVLEPRDRHGHRVDLFDCGKLDLNAMCKVERFEATGTCLTVDLTCFCAIQCVRDVFIDCDEN